MAEVPAMPEWLQMGREEAQQRFRLLEEGGRLASALRALEARTWRQREWLGELWLWVLFLVIVRGYRGRTTVANYVDQLGRFASWVESGERDYRALSATELDAWQRWLYVSRRNGVQARRASLMAVRSFYRWRSTRGVGHDVTEGYAAPKRVQRTPRKYTGPQLRALFEAARQSPNEVLVLRDVAMMLVLLAAGLRREEIATLRVDQLELGERKGMIHVFGKGAKERNVPIEGPVVRKLTQWLAARSEVPGVCTDAVFVRLVRHYSGGSLSVRSVEKRIDRLAHLAGLREWGVHRFRVTFATMLYDDGVDLERIRVLMGHESIETTRRYISISKRMNRFHLKAHRQSAALGEAPDGLPLWAKTLEDAKHGPGIF